MKVNWQAIGVIVAVLLAAAGAVATMTMARADTASCKEQIVEIKRDASDAGQRLEQVRQEIRGEMKDRFDQIRSDIAGTNAKLDALTQMMIKQSNRDR